MYLLLLLLQRTAYYICLSPITAYTYVGAIRERACNKGCQYLLHHLLGHTLEDANTYCTIYLCGVGPNSKYPVSATDAWDLSADTYSRDMDRDQDRYPVGLS